MEVSFLSSFLSRIHLAQDGYRRYGALDNISCFPFENFLGKIKKMVRRPQNPVSQTVRRIGENQKHDESRASVPFKSHKKLHLSGPLPQEFATYLQYKQYHGKESFISCSQGDNCFEVSGRVALVRNVLLSLSGDTHVVCEFLKKMESFFQILHVWGSVFFI